MCEIICYELTLTKSCLHGPKSRISPFQQQVERTELQPTKKVTQGAVGQVTEPQLRSHLRPHVTTAAAPSLDRPTLREGSAPTGVSGPQPKVNKSLFLLGLRLHVNLCGACINLHEAVEESAVIDSAPCEYRAKSTGSWCAAWVLERVDSRGISF